MDTNRPLPPARITLEQITTDRVEIYQQVPHLEGRIPVEADSFPIYDSIPYMDNIEWLVQRLRQHRLRGSSGMKSEYLKIMDVIRNT